MKARLILATPEAGLAHQGSVADHLEVLYDIDIEAREIIIWTDVDGVMTANPRTIAPDRPFGHALHLMYEGGFRNVPVVLDDIWLPGGLFKGLTAERLGGQQRLEAGAEPATR